MREHKMKFFAMLACIILFTGISFSGMAATNSEVEIDRVTVIVDADIPDNGGGASLNVDADSDRYTVDLFEFSGGKSNFASGEVPRINIVLTANDGYKFKTGFSKKKVSIRGDGICAEARRTDSGYSLELVVRLNPVSVIVGDIAKAYWADSPFGKAQWDSAENAGAYELRLYYKDSVIKNVDKTTTTVYDFRSYMTKVGDYYYKIRTIPRNTEEEQYIETGEWVTSPRLYADSSKVSSATGETSTGGNFINPSVPGGAQMGPGTKEGAGSGVLPKSASGGWTRAERGWKYLDGSGNSPANSWKQIDNKWYFFDMTGYMKTGWMDWNGGYYYLTVNGDMLTGWQELDRKWYYLRDDGLMVTGWQQINGVWYYMNVTGMMATGWQEIDQKWYYFDPYNGAMAANTEVGGSHVGSDGALIWK